jgi:hypothetical protein
VIDTGFAEVKIARIQLVSTNLLCIPGFVRSLLNKADEHPTKSHENRQRGEQAFTSPKTNDI